MSFTDIMSDIFNHENIKDLLPEDSTLECRFPAQTFSKSDDNIKKTLEELELVPSCLLRVKVSTYLKFNNTTRKNVML